MDNIIVRLISLPRGAEAVTMLDSEGDYNVYIDDRLSALGQRMAYDHELRHISLGHFHSTASINKCEKEARRR